jgi:RNA polymerase-associated protein
MEITLVSTRHSVMTLFSSAHDAHSHRTRLVLAEKGVSIDIVNVEPDSLPEDLLDLNPYHSVPTLVDRDLVLYDSRVIIEYLDERFPHPPLMPVDPVTRAQFRLALYRIERDWYEVAQQIEQDLTEKPAKNQAAKPATKLPTKDGMKSRRILRDSILATSEVFEAKQFFLSDEFSLVDATIAPILWRLPYYDIDLPAQAQAVVKYANTLFARPSFRDSLSAAEQEMRTPTG